MNKNLLLLITFLCTALSTSSLEANPKKLTCLVSGEKINVSDAETANYKDGKVYFCCPGCSSDFVENKNQYTAAANFQLVLTSQYAQNTCPATGRKIKKNTKTEPKSIQVNGHVVELCCGGCLKKTTKMTDAQRMEFLFSDKSFKNGYVLAKSKK